ncbi:MAG: hypothetical protein WCP98_15270 [Actinomycetes bacterium]
MSDDQRSDGLDGGGLAADGGYEPPKLSVYESEAPVEWAALRAGESAPDDTLKSTPASSAPASSTPSSSASPEVLHWSAPQPDYEYPDPETFVAPENPSRKVSPPKKVPKKTRKPGKETRAHTTKTRLTGHDAFGGSLCTCNLVCTCNQVCTCEAVAACSCVADSGTPAACTCDAVCTCQGVSSCTCQSDQPCSCQVEPY